jgi:hypothetical protein
MSFEARLDVGHVYPRGHPVMPWDQLPAGTPTTKEW